MAVCGSTIISPTTGLLHTNVCSKFLPPYETSFEHSHVLCSPNPRKMFKWSLCQRPRRGYTPVCNAGAAELGGFVPETSGKMKKKKNTVAGVDQDALVDDPRSIAEDDSFFMHYNGVEIHYKMAYHGASSDSGIGVPVILLHGFGASSFSWKFVMGKLAKLVGDRALAFDRPAFGLTSRVMVTPSSSSSALEQKGQNPYSLDFSVGVTHKFIDLLQAPKAILIGHSAGCLVAAKAYFENPEKIAALVLVAPAIVAPKGSKNVASEGKDQSDKKSSIPGQENPFMKIKSVFFFIWKRIAHTISKLMQTISEMATNLYRKALSAILRSSLAVMLIRFIFDKFGIQAIKYGWYDGKKVPQHVIEGYTKPLRCKGWERAFLEFTLSVLLDSAAEKKAPIRERVKEIKCPVLVVTGDADRMVPAWNSERLAKAIPGSKFEIIKDCGHLPQEEKAEEFLGAIQRFLQWAFEEKRSVHGFT